jgi:hypothetical protein
MDLLVTMGKVTTSISNNMPLLGHSVLIINKSCSETGVMAKISLWRNRTQQFKNQRISE